MVKKQLLFMALSFMTILTACNQEDETGMNDAGGDNTLNARIENLAVSRTAVDENGQVTWMENDCIGVFGNMQSTNVPFKLASGIGGTSACFQGDLSAGETADAAYYPYSETAVLQGKTLTFELPSEYVYTGNSQAPMLGVKTSGGEFEFRHLSGLLKIMLKDIPEGASEFVIASVGEHAPLLAGEAVVEDITSGTPVLQLSGEGANSVVYRLPNNLSEEELIFFVPIPTGYYAQLDISLMKNDGTTFFTKTLTDRNIGRAVMVEFPVLNGYTGDCYQLSTATKLITEELEAKVSLAADDKSTLIYTDVAESDLPKVGDIILSRSTDGLPDGFLGKVTDVSRGSDGSYQVTTGRATLSEAFDELYVNETINLVPEEGNGVQTKALMDNIFFDKEFTNTLSLTYRENNSYITGEIDLGAKIVVNLDFNKEKQMEYGAFTFELTARPHCDFGITFSTPDKYEELVRKRLSELKFCRVPLVYGLIQLFPTLTPYWVVEAKGEASLYTGFDTEYRKVVVALYKDGAWQSASGNAKPESNFESPWSVRSGFSLKGEVFAGLDNEFAIKLYNQDDAKIYFKPKIGGELSGEVNFELQQNMNPNSVADFLAKTKVTTSLSAKGIIGADASLLVPGSLEAEVEIAKFTFWEKELNLIPYFKQLTANVSKMLNGDGSEKPTSDAYQAEVNTEASGELLMKDMQIGLALVDDKGEIVETTPMTAYNGGGKTYETDPDVVVSLENEFADLQENSLYEVCPVVYSPVFENVAEEGRILLENQAVDISTQKSERDILIEFYKATGGDNWTNNTNWCSDKPLSEWYGVETDKEGNVAGISLQFNNLTNQADLTGLNKLVNLSLHNNKLIGLNVYGLKSLEYFDCQRNNIIKLSLSSLESLTYINCNFNQITDLNISSLSNLTYIYCNYNQIGSLDVSHFSKLTEVQCTYNQLIELNVVGLKNLQQLACGDNKLTKLDLSGLDKLETFGCAFNSLINIDLSALKNLKMLACHNNKLTALEGVSVLENLTTLHCYQNELTQLDLSKLKKVNDLRCDHNKIRSLDLSMLLDLEYLDCGGNQISSLDVSNLKYLKNLFCIQDSPMATLDISNLYNLIPENFEAVVETIYLSKDSPELPWRFWGEKDSSKYEEPNHKNGYQYPEFIYK